ncbi:hypothetical protein K3G39_06985 [Pontibacter sp. HSC-14F20]|uniref:hypothetical protein n=1 Tax=Pontibacter sp. HSC-14F20 TaxID=2864136 RepID=UPI001C732844|nr:hypothetical protein [Pontibacter sp. HSC-14F20]MBX0332978.1 hypothetical protein [Pontibacter sp. HSC-14F20]
MKQSFWSRLFGRKTSSAEAPTKHTANSTQLAMTWIEDENLLKDEAVLAAAADSDPVHKISTIEAYFSGKVAVVKERLESLKIRCEEAKQEESELAQLCHQIEQKLLALSVLPPSALQAIVRHFFGLVLYIAMCVGYGYFIYEMIKSYFEFPIPMAVGITALGFFALFSSRSILFKSNSAIKEDSEKKGGPEVWKVLFEELSVPLVVSVLVVSFGWNDRPIFMSILFVVATFVIFLIAGKSLLSTITKLRDEFATLGTNRKLNRQRKLEIKQQQQKLTEQKEQQKTASQKLEELQTQLYDTAEERHQLEAKSSALISLFKGEYELAKKALKTLTHHQISSITADGVLTKETI